MISEGAAYGITYGTLVCCALVAGAAVPMVYKSMKPQEGSKEDGGGVAMSADFWYSARSSQGWVSLGLSFFASSMGAWVLFAAPEVGAISGWWGTIGYALASSLPFGFYAILGPLVRRRYTQGFCLLDWVQQRFGRATQIYVALISVFYMWVYLVAELTSMGNLIRDFSGLDPLAALIPVSLVTMLYTVAAGLPASIWTDRVQGVIMVVFILVAIIACFTGLKITSESWSKAADWNDKGFESLVTLVFAILGAGLFDMGTWQRVYAAKDEGQLRKGLCFGVALIFPTMLLFGIAGMLAEAQDLSRPKPTLFIKALAFFDLLGSQPGWVAGGTFALATCMVASSVDSLQTGLVSVVSHEVTSKKLSPMAATAIGQLVVVSANVPAIYLAAKATKEVELGMNIINLFLVADLLTLSVAVPVFAGLGSMATQSGALAGCMSGLLLIMSFGWVEFGTFMAGLEMVTLMAFGNTKPTEIGLSASRTCIIFFLLPIVTGSVTFVVSILEKILDQLQKLNFTPEGQALQSSI